jgi:hypothetical protein
MSATVRRLTTFSLVAVAVVALLPGSLHPAHAAGTVLPFASVFDMVVDDAHDRVFVSGGAATATLPVYGFDGALVTSIPIAGATGMVLLGDTLYVSEASGPSIRVVDTAADPPVVVDTLDIDPFVQPGDLTEAAGKLWFFADSAADDDQLVSIDPDGTDLGAGFTAAANSQPRFVDGLPGGSELWMFDQGVSPATLTGYDATTDPVTFLRDEWNVGDASNPRQMAMMPDRASIVIASGAPYEYPQVRLSDLATLRNYAADPYPTAVAVTPSGGGLIVGGANGIYWPDVWAYAPGATVDTWHHDFEDPGQTVVSGGIAVADDANTVFVVRSNESGNPSFVVLAIDGTTTTEPSEVKVTVSPREVRYRGRVDVAVHLEGGVTNRTVAVYADANGTEEQVFTGEVNGAGNASFTHRPRERTVYVVRYDGDAGWSDAHDRSREVRVHARITARFVGGFARRDGYTLFRDGVRPKVAVAVFPNHAGDPVTYALQGRFSGSSSWVHLDEDAYALNDVSEGTARVLRTRPGIDFRVRVTFEGDARNRAASTPWMYFRVVASRALHAEATEADARLRLEMP